MKVHVLIDGSKVSFSKYLLTFVASPFIYIKLAVHIITALEEFFLLSLCIQWLGYHAFAQWYKFFINLCCLPINLSKIIKNVSEH